jgi:hypothetical protein
MENRGAAPVHGGCRRCRLITAAPDGEACRWDAKGNYGGRVMQMWGSKREEAHRLKLSTTAAIDGEQPVSRGQGWRRSGRGGTCRRCGARGSKVGAVPLLEAAADDEALGGRFPRGNEDSWRGHKARGVTHVEVATGNDHEEETIAIDYHLYTDARLCWIATLTFLPLLSASSGNDP